MRDMTDRARQAAGSGFPIHHLPGKKETQKIDPNVGEYVEFVEISTVRDELNTDNSKYIEIPDRATDCRCRMG